MIGDPETARTAPDGACPLLGAQLAERSGWTRYMERAAAARSSGGALGYAVRTLPTDSAHWVITYLEHKGDFDPMPCWNLVERPVVRARQPCRPRPHPTL